MAAWYVDLSSGSQRHLHRGSGVRIELRGSAQLSKEGDHSREQADLVRAPTPTPLPPMCLVELFAGAGGLALGFERDGRYEATALYDVFEPAQRSYLAYKPQARYELCDARELRSSLVQRALDGRPLHGLLGGPPCQGFSINGQRRPKEEVNQLVLTYAAAVDALRPSFLVMENVPQLLFHPLFEPLLARLRRDYFVSHGILNAARYGAPQTRHRLFLVAYSREFGIRPTLPAPTHGRRGQLLYAYHLSDSSERVALSDETAETVFGADPVIKDMVKRQATQVPTEIDEDLAPLVTVGDAIGDLNGPAAPSAEPWPYAGLAATDYQRLLRGDLDGAANCQGRKHVGKPLRLARELREGGQPEAPRGSKAENYFSQAYGRLHRDGLARTITTFFQNAGSGRFFHYERPRTLTIREAARLQGFPDDFVFYGTLAEQMQLVGNAVPLPLGEAVARHIAAELGPALSDRASG